MTDAELANIALAFAAFGVGMLSPGPNILAVVATSMADSRRHGIAVALGVGMGSGVWALAALAGLAAVLQLYASAMTALKIAGALYLAWLAIKSFRSALDPAPLTLRPTTDGSFARFVRRGLAVCLINPKAVLTYVAIMSIAMGEGNSLTAGVIVAVGTTIISTVGHVVYAQVFSSRPVVAAYARARRWIDGALGAFFAFASYKLATSRA